MSWLDDIAKDRVYNYKSEDGDIISGKHKELNELVGDELDCRPEEIFSLGGKSYTYAGFEPIKMGGETRIEFDQNGRKGVCINKGGKNTYISKSKLNYIKTGRIENEYTPAYKEHLQKTEQHNLLETEKKTNRAKVFASRHQKQAIKKNVPHHYIPTNTGWQSPDGKTFIPLD